MAAVVADEEEEDMVEVAMADEEVEVAAMADGEVEVAAMEATEVVADMVEVVADMVGVVEVMVVVVEVMVVVEVAKGVEAMEVEAMVAEDTDQTLVEITICSIHAFTLNKLKFVVLLVPRNVLHYIISTVGAQITSFINMMFFRDNLVLKRKPI